MRKENENVNGMGTKQLHLTASFTSAVDYARHIHIERRKGTDIPYMAHLLGVASLVMGEAGHAGFPVTEDMVIAALLHDAAEDQGGLRRLQDFVIMSIHFGIRSCGVICTGCSHRSRRSFSSPSPTRSITQEQFSKTIEKSGHGYGNDSSVGGQSRSGILMNS